MRFDVMTLFPDMMQTVLSESILGRAQKNGYITVGIHNIRDFAVNDYGRVDDTPYGGGRGMVMMAPPIFDCYQNILQQTMDITGTRRVIYLSPKGTTLTQAHVKRLSEYSQLILLCGHYEGVDQRVLDEIVDEEISVGDYVLTGGELPACIVIDAVSRLCEGVLPDKICYEEESFSDGLLEYPQYTRPCSFHGQEVPPVLISGNHQNIAAWRRQQAILLTKTRRPDLLASKKADTIHDKQEEDNE